MLKKTVSCLLIFVLLVQMLPMSALADVDAFLLSDGELNAALQLTGLLDGAAPYHDGMKPERNMNAMQIDGYVERLLRVELSDLMSRLQDISTALARLEEEDAASYAALTGEGTALAQLDDLTAQGQALADELTYAHDRLCAESQIILANQDKLADTDYSARERIKASQRTRQAGALLEEIIASVCGSYAQWEQDIESWNGQLDGAQTKRSRGTGDLPTLISRLNALHADDQYPVTYSVSAHALGVSARPTLLERLTPVRAAVAEPTGPMKVTVLDDSRIAIRVHDANRAAVADATVTLFDRRKTGALPLSGRTDASGAAVFDVSAFTVDSEGDLELGMKITADGYRRYVVKSVKLHRGNVRNVTLTQDNGMPYLSSATLNGNDVLYEENTVYFSPVNDADQVFEVGVVASGSYRLRMDYVDTDGKTRQSDMQLGSSGEKTFNFTNRWLQQIKPNTRVAFTLITDQGEETTPLQLNIRRGVVDKPLIDANGDTISSVLSPSLGFTLPSSLPKPLAGSTLSVSLPLEKYLPSFYLDMDGSVTAMFGIAPFKALRDKSSNWKTQTQKQLDDSQKAIEGLAIGARLRAAKDTLWDGGTSKKVKFLGGAAADLAFFAVLQGRYDKLSTDSDQTDYGKVTGAVTFGVTASFSTEWVAQYVIAYIGFEASASCAFALTAQAGCDTVWPAGKIFPTVKNFAFDTRSIGATIQIRIQIGVTGGLGLRHVASVSVTGYGYISLVLTLARAGRFQVFAGGGVSLTAQFLWIRYNMDIWKSGDKEIFSTRLWGGQTRSPLVRSAVADEPDINSASESYNPGMAVQINAVSGSLNMTDGQIRYALTDDGTLYAVYLRRDGETSTACLLTGFDQPALEVIPLDDRSGVWDYDVDIAAVGNEVIVSVLFSTSVREEVVQEGDSSITVMKPDGECYAAFYHVSAGSKDAGTMLYDDVRLSQPYLSGSLRAVRHGNKDIAMLALTGDRLGAARCEFEHSGNTVSVQQPEEAPFGSADSRLSYGQPQYGVVLPAGSSLIPPTTPCLSNASLYAVRADANGKKQLIHRVNDFSGKFPGAGQGRAGEFMLAEGEITAYHVLSGKWENDRQTDYLFYLSSETSAGTDGMARNRLQSIRLEHDTSIGIKLNQSVHTDYGIFAEATDFKIQTIAGVTYLYWLESVKAPSGQAYRIKAVTFSSTFSMLSDPVILAEITPQQPGESIADVQLTPNGKGYALAVRADAPGGDIPGVLYAFDFRIVTGLDITAAALEDEIASAGSYEEMLFAVCNNGNVAITGFDLELLHGENEVFETIHVDCLNSEANSITVKGRSGDSRSGDSKSVYRIDNVNDTSNGDAWYITHTTLDYTVDRDTPRRESREQWSATRVLMPGAKASYQAAIHICADWRGEQSLRLRVAKIYTAPNWYATVQSDAPSRYGLRAANRMQEDVMEFSLTRENDESGSFNPEFSVENSDDEAYAVWQQYNKLYKGSITFDREPLNTDKQDLELDASVYRLDGERYVELTLINRAQSSQKSRRAGDVTLSTYADNDDSRSLMRYTFPEEIAAGRTYTLTLPLHVLTAGTDPKELTIRVSGGNGTDRDALDNRVVLRLRHDPLSFARQPEDQMVQEGMDAVFPVEIAGGSVPYTYRWQVRSDASGAWRDIAQSDTGTLTLPAVTDDMDGWQVRCVVTDGNFDTLTSAIATLRVVRLPQTGDTRSLAWPAGLLGAALCLLLLILLQSGRRRT